METKQSYLAPEMEMIDFSSETSLLSNASAFGMYIQEEEEF